MAAPCVLVSSCSSYPPCELVKSILSEEKLPAPEELVEEIKAYPWHIDTKYYIADVKVCPVTNKTIGNEEFAESVEAVIIHFDTTSENSFALAKSWLPFLKEMGPAVQLLVCDRCKESDVIPKLTIQHWCLDNSFELIELDPPEVEGDSDDEDFRESNGIPRVIQALKSHTWSNLEMKENPSYHGPVFRKMMEEMAEENQRENGATENTTQTHSNVNSSESAQSNHASSQVTESHVDSSTAAQGSSTTTASNGDSTQKTTSTSSSPPDFDDDMALLAALGNEDPGEQSFEQLFGKLKLMKDRAEQLPPEQRKAYAEKIAMEFWRAVGGDEDEIEGLSDDDVN